MDTWRRDAAADRVKERLNKRVDKHGNYVEIADVTISQDAIEEEEGNVWSLSMVDAMYNDFLDNSIDGNKFIVLDYVPDSANYSAPFTEVETTMSPPPIKVVFANYEHVVHGRLYDVKNEGNPEQYKEPLPDPETEQRYAGGWESHQVEPDYDVSEMAFWIYRRLAPLIDDDIEYDPSALAGVFSNGRSTGSPLNP